MNKKQKPFHRYSADLILARCYRLLREIAKREDKPKPDKPEDSESTPQEKKGESK